MPPYNELIAWFASKTQPPCVKTVPETEAYAKPPWYAELLLATDASKTACEVAYAETAPPHLPWLSRSVQRVHVSTEPTVKAAFGENLIDVNNGDHADEVLADIDTKVIARFLGAE